MSASAADVQRYFVATRQPAKAAIVSLAQRHATPFELFQGFAADLTASEAAALQGSSDVRWVEPVLPRHRADITPRPNEQVIPTGIAQVRAPEAWIAHQSAVINVAVIDTGVDYRHPEFKFSWAGGMNILDPAAPPLDDSGHGTHVAGTIAAGNNRFGVVGVARGVRLWGVKVLDAVGDGNTESVIKGLQWVVDKKREVGGRWVVNLSLTGTQQSWAEQEALQHAFDAGLLIVAAAGNHIGSTPDGVAYPAAVPGVLAVGAVDDANHVAYFSNEGPELDLVAPGVNVWSTALTGTNTIGWSRRTGGPLYEGRPLTGSKLGKVTAEYIYCGVGRPEEVGYDVKDKIVIMKRGVETFGAKTRRARDHGAAAVVIFNDRDDTNLNWTLNGPNEAAEEWPIAVALLQKDGEALIAQGGGALTIGAEPHDYILSNGTSMAAPHVAGAAAFLWSLAPNATPAAIITALTATATDLGSSGHDPVFGYGLLDVYAAAQMLMPGAFLEADPSRPQSPRRSTDRGKQ